MSAEDEVVVSLPASAAAASSSAFLESMLDTDDPFNTKKKSSAAVGFDDVPIAGNRAAQHLSAAAAAEDEQPTEQPPHSAAASSPPPARSRPPLKSRRPPASRRAIDASAAAEDDGDKENAGRAAGRVRDGKREEVKERQEEEEEEEQLQQQTQAVQADEADAESAPVTQPMRARQSRAAVIGSRGEADEPQPRPEPDSSSSSAAAALSSPPSPPLVPTRSSAAALAALLDTDDPFNSRKKPGVAASFDELPIGGSKAAQQQLSELSDLSEAQQADGSGPSSPPQRPRPPVRQRARQGNSASAAVIEDGGAAASPSSSPGAAWADSAPAAADSSSTSSATGPRRPVKPAKAKTEAAAAAAKKPAAGAGAAAPASASSGSADVKLDVLKVGALLPLAEAEAALSSALPADVLTLLQSKKWSEAVEALGRLSAEAESLGCDAVVPLLPALLSFLSAYPSFKPANFNVCRAVYDCYGSLLSLYLASAACELDATLVFSPLPDVLGKLSDAKLVDSVCSLLTLMAECVGARAMLHNAAAVLVSGSFKSVKAQEAGVRWLVQLSDEFGIGALDAMTAIELCCSYWLQSGSKGVKDEALRLLLSILRQSGSLLKDKILSQLKPAAAKELEAMLAALPADSLGKVTASRRRKGEKEAAALNVDALLPRVDISPLMTDRLLKRLADDNWKERKEAMDEVEAAIRASSCRILPKDGGVLELLGKWRLVDKNKNLSRDALSLLQLFCSAMGRPIASYRDRLVPNLFVCLADSKKLVKDEAVKAVSVWVETAGIASVSKYLPKALSVAGSRLELLELMAAAMKDDKRFKKERRDIELDDWIAPLISCLQDKTSDVRLQAERVLELLCPHVGLDALQDGIKSLKKAEVLKIQPCLDRLKKQTAAADDDSAPPQHDRAADDDDRQQQQHSASRKTAGASRPSSAAASSASAKSRPAASASAGSSRPASEAAREKAEAASDSAGGGVVSGSASDSLVRRVDAAAKASRVRKDAKRVKGAYRDWGSDEVEEMSERLRELVSDSFHAQLFHRDFARQLQAVDALESLLGSNAEALLSVLDLVLRWCSWRMVDANTALLLKLLHFLQSLLQQLQLTGYRLHEGEACDLLPFLVEKVLGHGNAKFRTDCRELLRLSCALYDEKAVFAFVATGMDSKNKRVQSESIDLQAELMLQHGLSVGDARKQLVSIATQVGASDAAVRAAALSAIGSLYERYGDVVYQLMGAGKRGAGGAAAAAADCKIPPKQMAMIDERLKRIKPGAAAADDGAGGGGGGGGGEPGSRTPQRKSATTPPASVAASPRPAGRTMGSTGSAMGGAVGRTPVRAAGAPSRVGTLSRPASAAQGQTVDEEEGAVFHPSSSSASSSEIGESRFAPPASPLPASLPPARQSFTASISSELPACFSLDLDSAAEQPQTGSSAARSPHSPAAFRSASPAALMASAYSLPPPESNFSPSPSPAAFTFPRPSPSVPAAAAPLVSQLPAFLPSANEEERVESMKTLWELVIASKAAVVAGQTDAVVAALIRQVELSFVEQADGSVSVNHRYCRYALNTLMELFKLPALVAELTVGTLRCTARLLLTRLMDERLKSGGADAQSKQLMQAINVLVLKVMENSDRTATLHVLISFLTQPEAEAEQQQPAFVELVIRCLSKLIRSFQSSGMQAVDAPVLLLDIHRFLCHAPHPAPAAAETADGQPQQSPQQLQAVAASRAVRSILALLVQVKGESIVPELQRVLPADSPVLPVVERSIASWKLKNQQGSMTGSQLFTPGFRSPAFHPPQAQQATPTHSAHAASRQRHEAAATPAAPPPFSLSSAMSAPASSSAELSRLVQGVLTPATTRSSLTALAAFALSHPEVDVLQPFAGHSDSFRAYVQRSVQTAPAAAASGLPSAPSSSSFSSSPSSSQRLSAASSTEALRQRLAALQSKAKTVTAAAEATTAAATQPQSRAASPSLPATATAAAAAARYTSSAVTRPATPLEHRSSTAATALPAAAAASPGAPRRSSLSSSASIDAIKQRFAAVHGGSAR